MPTKRHFNPEKRLGGAKRAKVKAGPGAPRKNYITATDGKELKQQRIEAKRNLPATLYGSRVRSIYRNLNYLVSKGLIAPSN